MLNVRDVHRLVADEQPADAAILLLGALGGILAGADDADAAFDEAMRCLKFMQALSRAMDAEIVEVLQ